MASTNAMSITPKTTLREPLPEWTRFPRSKERERITGLSRPSLYRLRAAGLITVKNLRRPGQVRGVALISVASLLACIEKHGVEQTVVAESV